MPRERKKKKRRQCSFQIPRYFYQREALYWSGDAMELEHFRRVVLLEENKLCVETGRGTVTVTGTGLTVEALERDRILLKGQFQQVTFSPWKAPRKESR